MAEERVSSPKFSGDEDDYCVWFLRAKAYATRFGFAAAMSATAEIHIPAAEGPGANPDEIAAVERNMKAAAFLTSAMPNSQVINVMAAGIATRAWPNQPKAHLMIAYLKETFEDTTTLSRVGAKRDLESCVMKKDDDPKKLFEKLIAVQYKYTGNAHARVEEADLVTQAVQALPAVYNSTVANLFETERRAGNDVTISALKQAVGNYYSIAMKGKQGPKTKDIEGGFGAMDAQATVHEKDNLKRMIQETVNTTIREFQIKSSTTGMNQGQSGGGHGLTAVNNAVNMGQPNMGLTPEIVMAIMQAAKGNDQNQIDTATMLCYNCGHYGHRSDQCKNAKNFELVSQVLKSQGRTPCEHCGRFGHPSAKCWKLPSNAHLRPLYWNGPHTHVDPTNATTGPYESVNMSIDNEDKECEYSLTAGHIGKEEADSINESLKDIGLSLNDPNVWIGDTGATTHITAYIENSVNHREAKEHDSIVGVTGPPAKVNTIVDIPCEVQHQGKTVKMSIKDVTYAPEGRFNLMSLTKLILNGWTMSGDKIDGIKMINGKHELHFNRAVHTPKGVLYVMVMKRCEDRANKINKVNGMSRAVNTNITIECGAAATDGTRYVEPITINQTYAAEQHSAYETGDVKKEKGMLYEPEKKEGLHAVNSVDLIVNKQNVPLSKVNKPNTVAMPKTKKEKEKVKIKKEVEDTQEPDEPARENVPEPVEHEREDEAEPGKQVDCEKEEKEECKEACWTKVGSQPEKNPLTLSSGLDKVKWGAKSDVKAVFGIVERVSGNNFYSILRDEIDEEKFNGKVNVELGEKGESENGGSEGDPKLSDVDSQDYSGQNDGEVQCKDDDAFFEKLAEMPNVFEWENQPSNEGKGERNRNVPVELSMVQRVENQGVREHVNNWSVGGQTRHIATKAMFLRELKEWGWLKVEYLLGSEMSTDVLTKNLAGPLFAKHSAHYVTDEEYAMAEKQQAREAAGMVKTADKAEPGIGEQDKDKCVRLPPLGNVKDQVDYGAAMNGDYDTKDPLQAQETGPING